MKHVICRINVLEAVFPNCLLWVNINKNIHNNYHGIELYDRNASLLEGQICIFGPPPPGPPPTQQYHHNHHPPLGCVLLSNVVFFSSIYQISNGIFYRLIHHLSITWWVQWTQMYNNYLADGERKIYRAMWKYKLKKSGSVYQPPANLWPFSFQKEKFQKTRSHLVQLALPFPWSEIPRSCKANQVRLTRLGYLYQAN